MFHNASWYRTVFYRTAFVCCETWNICMLFEESGDRTRACYVLCTLIHENQQNISYIQQRENYSRSPGIDQTSYATVDHFRPYHCTTTVHRLVFHWYTNLAEGSLSHPKQKSLFWNV